MIDNRDLIYEGDLVKREQLLEKGLPLLLLSGKYQVKEGFCAVLTEGGVYKETLRPGFYYLSKYKLFRDLCATLVDMRTKRLEIRTNRKYQIISPVPVQLDLDLSIEYKVSDPRLVALEYEEPLHALFDRINEVIDPIIGHSSYEEVLLQRNSFAIKVADSVKAMQLQKTLGIDVRNVIITNLKSLDAGDDAIASGYFNQMEQVNQAKLDAYILANTPKDFLSMIMMADPNKRLELFEKMIDVGWGSSEANVLMQQWGGANQLQSGINQFGFSQMAEGNLSGMPFLGIGMGSLNQAGQGQSGQLPAQGNSTQNRIVDELNMLKSVPGAVIETKSVTDTNGLATGVHLFKIDVPKSSGGHICIVFQCSPQYPSTAPIVAVDVDGDDYPFEPTSIRNWRGNYLVEIVREVISSVG